MVLLQKRSRKTDSGLKGKQIEMGQMDLAEMTVTLLATFKRDK